MFRKLLLRSLCILTIVGWVSAQQPVDLEKFTNGNDIVQPTELMLTCGDDVQWTYVVTNNTCCTINSVVVTDNQGVAVSCPRCSDPVSGPADARAAFRS